MAAYRTLISTGVFANERRDDWVVVDCRFDLHEEGWGHRQYLHAHIPGAVYAGLNNDLSGPPAADAGGRHPLPAHETLITTFGRLGMTRGTQVVAYDQDSGLFASRLWWLLRCAGHDEVAVLDGGWSKWLREARPARHGDERPQPTTFRATTTSQKPLNAADVAGTLNDFRTLLVDARAPERFEGRVEPLDRIAGHIPGAVNHFYKWNLSEDGTMLTPRELEERYRTLLAGRGPDDTVFYCGSGVSACHNLLAMEHAGLPGARLYPGSWSEWASDPDRPVETGTGRR